MGCPGMFARLNNKKTLFGGYAIMTILLLKKHKKTIREHLGLTKKQPRKFQIYTFQREAKPENEPTNQDA